MALLLALARNVPQAHSSLTGGRLGPLEVQRRRAGREDARHPRLRPHRPARGAARARLRHARARLRRIRGRGALRASWASSGRRPPTTSTPGADFITIHLPKTPETENWLDAEAFAKMKDGVRVINVARGQLVVDDDLRAALDSGKVAGAALDVFREEPITDHPLFGYAERDRHAAPGRLHRRGHRPRRLPGGRAGGGRAHRRRRHERGERARGRRRGHGGARPVPAARARARPHRRRARRAAPRSTASRSSTWAASPSATRACSPCRC